MERTRIIMLFAFLSLSLPGLFAQETQVFYLSGTGSDKTVDWEFFCTEGRNSGKWTTIPVPSNWEQFGFGKYNYGQDKDTAKGREKGLYKYTFNAPALWKGKSINIVFEGSMTDTEVKINGKLAGTIHQGAFYRFKYDISKLLKYGQTNLLEVTVSKHSANESINNAEREGDFWIFGGIFRPVYLEILPSTHITNIKLDAKANGQFQAFVFLKNMSKAYELSGQIKTISGENVGKEFRATVQKNGAETTLNTAIESPALWSPEFPTMYKVEIKLLENGKPIHVIEENFGFRTVELRERDGIYLNGQKIKFKGVNRHSFRPETGRAMNKKQCIEDVELIKDMNMNAVRNAHYPADEYFLDACDSLGLLVMDELTGWHGMYDTETGTRLVVEMLESNHNHPGIIIWANGNEGGHNFDLDPVFDNHDVQKRPVCHPWETFRGMDTQHYINYDYGNSTHFHGHDIVFPTEFLHGLYDGGHGAGLFDYWEYMWNLPLSAGGFLWDFADAGIVRTDKNGEIDTDGNHGADGILGPHHEKEGSYYTIKEVWSPVFFEHREITSAFDGTFRIENRYMFTNTNQCKFEYTLAGFPKPDGTEEPKTISGVIDAPTINPCEKGILSLKLPENWNSYDVLYIKATNPYGKELFTWSWPISLPSKVAKQVVKLDGKKPQILPSADTLLVMEANGNIFTLNKNTGLLSEVKNTRGIIPFNNGPVLCDGTFDFKSLETSFEGDNLVVKYVLGEKSSYKEMKWIIYPSGWISLKLAYRPSDYEFDMLGISFSYPENMVTGVKWLGDGPYRVWKNRMEGNKLGLWQKQYNNTITGKRDYIYPEFKGYYSNLYWAKILTREQNFTIVTTDEDIFLRLFTPEFPGDPYNTAPVFPKGDISFMHGIPAMGTKSQVAVNMGPSGKKNMYFDYWKQRSKNMELFFDFSGR